MPDHFSKLRLAIPPLLVEDVLHGVAVVMDEIRLMEASFDEVSQVLSRIANAQCRQCASKFKPTI